MNFTTAVSRGTTGLGFGLLAVFAFGSVTSTVLGQGCVAIRGTCQTHLEQFAQPSDADLASGEWLASTGFRWFHSEREFVGTKELPGDIYPQNSSYFWDLSVQYAFNPRWSMALLIPFSYSTRSTVDEHPGAGRHTTSAGGIGDIQLTPYVWLWDPAKPRKGNIQFGMGLSAPSGDYRATDTFYTRKGPVTGYVDPSIQPGTGGWGFTTSVTAYRELVPRLTGFVNGTYLFNPGDVNGTPTRTGAPRRNPFEQVDTIPDQYFGQGGFMYTVAPKWGLALGVGARIDGVPAVDALGESNGFRRPGYAVSVEPLMQWMRGRYTLSVNVPVAVYRNRTQSVPEEEWSDVLGFTVHGGASFADVSVIANFAVSF